MSLLLEMQTYGGIFKTWLLGKVANVSVCIVLGVVGVGNGVVLVLVSVFMLMLVLGLLLQLVMVLYYCWFRCLCC